MKNRLKTAIIFPSGPGMEKDVESLEKVREKLYSQIGQLAVELS